MIVGFFAAAGEELARPLIPDARTTTRIPSGIQEGFAFSPQGGPAPVILQGD